MAWGVWTEMFEMIAMNKSFYTLGRKSGSAVKSSGLCLVVLVLNMGIVHNSFQDP
jgi:hypothetical protein